MLGNHGNDHRDFKIASKVGLEAIELVRSRFGARVDRDAVARELTEKHGGLTAYARAPAAGLWMEGEGSPQRDDIVVYEVMVERLDTAWWSTYRSELEAGEVSPGVSPGFRGTGP